MKKVIIFGTGCTGQKIFEALKDTVNIIGFMDNNKQTWGTELFGKPVLGNAMHANRHDFDEIYIGSLPGLVHIEKELIEAGVDRSKINKSFVETSVNARVNFLREFAEINAEIKDFYSVAEGGVYQGEYSKEINRYFPDSKLYLFDTFEGFKEEDIKIERSYNFSRQGSGHLNNTSEQLVLSKLPHKEKVEIRRGYFPDTAYSLENEEFIFVSLDFDLYNPTLAGLSFFFPKMIKGGCILVHDYFTIGYGGVKQAVEEFKQECKEEVLLIPIGDAFSVAIIKGNNDKNE